MARTSPRKDAELHELLEELVADLISPDQLHGQARHVAAQLLRDGRFARFFNRLDIYNTNTRLQMLRCAVSTVQSQRVLATV